jgi:glucosamine 6-phosphate synthetase-like amidotransferase/phosphosugar isomerase protein
MCGIAGFLAPNMTTTARRHLAARLLLASMSRGRSATGLGYHKQGAPLLMKAEGPADDFVRSDAFKELKDLPQAVILHARATTKGTEKNNVNNHPVCSKSTGIMLVHNGTVEDDDWRLKDDSGVNPYIYEDFDGEVDTEAILRLIETMRLIPRQGDDLQVVPEQVAATEKTQWIPLVDWFRAIDDATYNIKGSFACAMLVPEEPDSVYLWRHSSPLYVAYVPEWDAVVWASTEQILANALASQDTKWHFNFFPVVTQTCPEYFGVDLSDDTLLKIDIVMKSKGRVGFNIQEHSIDPPKYERRRAKITPASGQVQQSQGQFTNLLGTGK